MANRRETVAALTAILTSAPLLAREECIQTPATSDGPYYFDPKLVRTDIAEGHPGVRLKLVVRVLDVYNCKGVAGARVDVWHSDARGIYSGYDRQRGVGIANDQSTKGKTFLRGTQFSDATGDATFHTIYPSWYYGRTPHVHFKVFVPQSPREAMLTSQIYFPEEISKRVFEQPPYSDARDTFNGGDRFARDRMQGVMCAIEPDGKGYRGLVEVPVKNL